MLTKIDLDIEKPQNTVFTVGDKTLTLTDVNANTRQDVTDRIDGVISQTKQEVADAVTNSENRINTVISEQVTAITRTCESMIFSALTAYVGDDEFASYKETVSAQLEVLSSEISLTFTKLMSEITDVDGDLQEKFNLITKYFTFDINGLTIGQVDSPYKVVLDNDRYSMYVNNVEVLWIANGQVYTPEIIAHRMANILGIRITKDANGRINGEYTGEGA